MACSKLVGVTLQVMGSAELAPAIVETGGDVAEEGEKGGLEGLVEPNTNCWDKEEEGDDEGDESTLAALKVSSEVFSRAGEVDEVREGLQVDLREAEGEVVAMLFSLSRTNYSLLLFKNLFSTTAKVNHHLWQLTWMWYQSVKGLAPWKQ